jgi:alpha-L-fucosidase 2
MILHFLVFIGGCNAPDEHRDEYLWYRQPAQRWEEALPLGNGRLGIMVFGNPVHEHIQLNDDSMWPGDPGWDKPEGGPKDLDKIRQLLFAGNHAEADKLFVEKFSRKSVVRSHQTLGNLHIELNHENITDYRRALDIGHAVASVSYKTEGKRVTEELYVSKPHQAIIIEIDTERSEGLNGLIRLSRPDDEGYPTASTRSAEGNLLILDGEVTQRGGVFNSDPFPIEHGVGFQTCLKLVNEGGEVIAGEDHLEMKNVRKAIFYIVSNSSWYHSDYVKQNEINLKYLAKSSIEAIRAAHIEDYKALYSRVELEIGDRGPNNLPTDQRIARVQQGSTDPGLEALLFLYGRYLLISSSRPGTNPANLQGLWNPHIIAPWNGDYHLNINLQMNYWPANPTHLSELNMPLFDFIDRLVENGKAVARTNFGCRGSFIPHATDIWAPTWLRAPTAYWGCSVGAAGWLMQHYWHHFEYTLDTLFLKTRAYPAIREVTLFYSDWLVEDPRDDFLVSAPSTSPENQFLNPEGIPAASCLGSAMDQQIIAEVFRNFLKASHVLKMQDPLIKKVQQQLDRLRPGFVLGNDGRILEWDREYEEMEPGHRHMSHLYGFHPGSAVTKSETPELLEAVRKTLDYRLQHGGAGTGWSRAWLINCSARLLDGPMAHENIRLFVKNSVYPNLFDQHPPFQIDGNFGFTAGVAEMLIQSHEDHLIRILPALPAAWTTGYVKGLKARNGILVDISWENGQLERVVLHPQYSQTIRLVYGNLVETTDLEKGKRFVFSP